MIKISRGLDLPISGAPEQVIHDGPKISQVALVGTDYPGMKPTMAVREGDRIALGQLLFTDKKNEGVRYTAPAAGTVVAINRGERRVFQSLVIDVDGELVTLDVNEDVAELVGVRGTHVLDRTDDAVNLDIGLDGGDGLESDSDLARQVDVARHPGALPTPLE